VMHSSLVSSCEVIQAAQPPLAGGTIAAAIAPGMVLRADAEVTAVVLYEDQLDELVAAERVRESPGCSLIAPHQRGVNDETMIHAERQCRLQRLQGVVAAVGIAGIVGLAHAADEVPCRA